MKNSGTLLRLLGPLAIAFTAGCAPAYYSNSGCGVDCQYCAPSPLPYTHYDECACHSCAASKYLTIRPKSPEQEVEVDRSAQ